MKQYLVPSVDTAARVLAMLTRYRTRSSTLGEISVALGVPKTTCLRVVKTLERHSLLRYDEPNRRYSLGYYCVVLGARADEGLDYLSYVHSLMLECTRRTGLTAAFAQQVSADRMMYVAKEQGGNITDVTVSIGHRFPITAASYGKWVLAFAIGAERNRLLADGLPRVTPQTTTDVAEYRAQVDALSTGDILVSRAEYVPGVVAVSCPVVDAHGDLLGVLVVLGLVDALSEVELDGVCAVMRETAALCVFDRNQPPAPVAPGGEW